MAEFKFGIIYLNYVPDGLNVKILRDIMGQFGEVGKIYLVPDEHNRKNYIEGWIEFKKKRVAKEVAAMLNGTTLQYGKKHSRINGQVWSIKYLHKFKWAHLTEQLVLAKAEREQRRRFEMTQTKKQVDFYQKMISKSKSKHITTKRTTDKKVNQNTPTPQGKELTSSVDETLLSCIFKKVE